MSAWNSDNSASNTKQLQSQGRIKAQTSPLPALFPRATLDEFSPCQLIIRNVKHRLNKETDVNRQFQTSVKQEQGKEQAGGLRIDRAALERVDEGSPGNEAQKRHLQEPHKQEEYINQSIDVTAELMWEE